MAVKKYLIDLSQVASEAQPLPVFQGGNRIASISITNFPAGATPFRLHLGSQDGFPITSTGAITGIEDEEDAKNGLFYSNPTAQPGLQAEIMVGFSKVPFPPGSSTV